MDNVYVDYAAATPLDPDVLEAMQPYFVVSFFNPSATYLPAKQVRQAVDDARATVAHWLGVRPAEVIFTSGGTEANNLAIHGVMRQFPDGNVVVSAIEHESVLAPAHQYSCREAAVTTKGLVDITKLVKQIDDQTVLVSVMYANNEVGTIQPIRQIARELENIRTARKKTGNAQPLYFHTDAAQAVNYLDIHTARLGVDLMTINGGKIYGPKGSGALFVGRHVHLQPVNSGGGQERGLRSGTENVPGCIGLAKALDIAQTRRQTEAGRLQALQTLFINLLKQKNPNVVINGSLKQRLPNNVHITIPGADNERLLVELEEQGILAAAGSACSASSEEPSHVLRAMGLNDQDAQASLRFTMGHNTTQQDIKRVIIALGSK
ncbi:MAG TPA: cysteine desulfurase family protein [Candidatus Saccharimonadales bacterium]|nr:cysteine desulfurase family protein [Candidatus Saccharimonadales bacterium]